MSQFHKLQRNDYWGFGEDTWDQMLESTCGVKIRHEENVSWRRETKQAMRDVSARINAHREKRVDMARKMQDIVEKEQALADQERMERRNEKHRERKQRRLERKAASNEPASSKPASNEPASDGAPSKETV